MKKMILTFSVMLTTVLSVFANVTAEPDQLVLNAFKKEFGSAENVKWDKQDDFNKATFVLAGTRVVAFFNNLGELEGCIRDIFFDQLPISVMTAVDKRFGDAEVINVREITNADGTSYKILVESKKKKYNLRISATGNINEVERVRK